MWLNFIFVSIFCILNVRSFQDGAPITACETMMPLHIGNQDQFGDLPVTLEVQTPIVSGEPVNIRILGTNLLPSFGGFQIQARTQNDQLIGTFQVSENVGVMSCRNISGSSATHRNSAQKTSVEIIWLPPITTELLIFNFQ